MGSLVFRSFCREVWQKSVPQMPHQASDCRLRLVQSKSGRSFVQFNFQGKRYRFANGSVLGLDLHPNRGPISSRHAVAIELLMAFQTAISTGWTPHQPIPKEISLPERIEAVAWDNRFTDKYKRALDRTRNAFLEFVLRKRLSKASMLTNQHVSNFLDGVSTTPSTFNHERKRLCTLLNRALIETGLPNPTLTIPKRREVQNLHQPFDDVQAVLAEIREFNENLWLCCLLTYGCLLRPHQEIRQLTWGDFSEDMSFISLSGSRNKSGRNRIVPVSPYIAQNLVRGTHTDNIFTGSEKPYNSDYFKTLWGKYRKRSKLLQPNQTLYSFRHTGAIEIYKRTGSLTVLQQAMGHASLAVSLGYLRNLEVPMLKVEDMPKLQLCRE